MRNPSSSDSKSYDQNIVGTALSWTPDNWTFSFGGGWYQNFLTTKKPMFITISRAMPGVLSTLPVINSRLVSMR
jgi:hypothetical protein